MARRDVEQFDANAEELRCIFEASGVRAVRGSEELQGIEIFDRVGYVRIGSKSIVFHACSI